MKKPILLLFCVCSVLTVLASSSFAARHQSRNADDCRDADEYIDRVMLASPVLRHGIKIQ